MVLPGLRRLGVERGAQPDDAVLLVDQIAPRRLEAFLVASGVSGPGHHGPGLRQAVDHPGLVGHASERLAVIVGGAQPPAAVPGVFGDGGLERRRALQIEAGAFRLALLRGDRREALQDVVEEERQPDAFALALGPDVAHPVVPVAGPHERQAVLSHPGQRQVDGPRGMLVDGAGLRRGFWDEAAVALPGAQLPAEQVGLLLL